MNNYLKLKWYDIVLLLILFFLGALLLNPLFSFLAKKLNINPYIFTPIMTIGNYVIIYITYYYINLKDGIKNFKFNYSLKNSKLFPIALLLFFGQYLVSEFLTGLVPTQGGLLEKMYKTMSYALLGNASHYPVITFISVCIVAPIFEELFFRGFILKGMLNNQIKPQKAILISALIFGGIHMFPWQVISGFLAGIVLGLTFYKTGSLLTCTILHCINNIIGFIFFIQYKSLESPNLGFNDFTLFIVGIIIIVIFGSIYMNLTKNQSWKSY